MGIFDFIGGGSSSSSDSDSDSSSSSGGGQNFTPTPPSDPAFGGDDSGDSGGGGSSGGFTPTPPSDPAFGGGGGSGGSGGGSTVGGQSRPDQGPVQVTPGGEVVGTADTGRDLTSAETQAAISNVGQAGAIEQQIAREPGPMSTTGVQETVAVQTTRGPRLATQEGQVVGTASPTEVERVGTVGGMSTLQGTIGGQSVRLEGGEQLNLQPRGQTTGGAFQARDLSFGERFERAFDRASSPGTIPQASVKLGSAAATAGFGEGREFFTDLINLASRARASGRRTTPLSRLAGPFSSKLRDVGGLNPVTSTEIVGGAGRAFSGIGQFAGRIGTNPAQTGREAATGAALLATSPTARQGVVRRFGRQVSQSPGAVAGSIGAELSLGGTRSLTAVPRGARAIRRASPIKIRRVNVPGQPTATTLGFEAGSRAKPLITSIGDEIQLGKPKFSQPTRLAAGQEAEVPVSALGTQVFRRGVDLSPADQQRLDAIIRGTRAFKGERGRRVRDIIFNVEGIENPKAATSEIEDFAKQQEGVFFGSTTTQQLPKGFQTRLAGDVDIFSEKPPSELQPAVKNLAQRLKSQGEDVRVSQKDPLTIETTEGKKVLEVKSGQDPSTLGEELAPEGFAGFRFADLKGGQSPRTVRFGGSRAIRAGEQLKRKGSAVSITRGPSTQAPRELQGAGVLGRGRRSLKDIAGFEQSLGGLAALRRKSILKNLNPLARARTARGERALSQFKGTFTPEQRAVIENQLSETTGTIPLATGQPQTAADVSRIGAVSSPSVSSIGQASDLRGFASPTLASPRISQSPRVGGSPRPSASPRTTSRSPSPRTTSPSPRSFSPSSIAGSPNIRSPSPVSRSPVASPPVASPPISPRSPVLSPSRSPFPIPRIASRSPLPRLDRSRRVLKRPPRFRLPGPETQRKKKRKGQSDFREPLIFTPGFTGQTLNIRRDLSEQQLRGFAREAGIGIRPIPTRRRRNRRNTKNNKNNKNKKKRR